jgi:hypothetical protein
MVPDAVYFQFDALTFALTGRASALLAEGNVTAAAADAERALEVARRLKAMRLGRAIRARMAHHGASRKGAKGQVQRTVEAFTIATSHLAQTLGREHPDTLSADRALAELRKQVLERRLMPWCEAR